MNHLYYTKDSPGAFVQPLTEDEKQLFDIIDRMDEQSQTVFIMAARDYIYRKYMVDPYEYDRGKLYVGKFFK